MIKEITTKETPPMADSSNIENIKNNKENKRIHKYDISKIKLKRYMPESAGTIFNLHNSQEKGNKQNQKYKQPDSNFEKIVKFIKYQFSPKRLCVNATKLFIIGGCIITSYLTIFSNINDIQGLQNNYKELENNITEIENTYTKIKKDNTELKKKISETKETVQATEEKAAEVEKYLNESKDKVAGLQEIVEKNATIR